jgi:hypothetical protein
MEIASTGCIGPSFSESEQKEFEEKINEVAKANELTNEQVRSVLRSMYPETATYVFRQLAEVAVVKLIRVTPGLLCV